MSITNADDARALKLYTSTNSISDRYRYLYYIYSNNANFNNHLLAFFFLIHAND